MTERHFSPLPRAPRDWPDADKRIWNELVEAIEKRERFYHKGLVGNQYTVSGTPPVSATVDLTSIEVTATTRTVAKLLKDLRAAGILDVILKT